MRTCTKCGEEKPLSGFYREGATSSGTWCRSCHIADAAARKTTLLATDPTARERQREWGRKSERRRKLRSHGVPEAQIDSLMAEAATGTCHACGRSPVQIQIPVKSATRLHVDHDHVTNLYRGLLCQPCNSALGLVDDDVARLEALIRYLKEHDMRTQMTQDLSMLGGQA